MRTPAAAAVATHKLPTMAEVAPGYVERIGKILELQTELEKLLAETGALSEAVGRMAADKFVPPRRPSGPQPDPLSPAARAALGSLAPPPPGSIPAPDLTRESALDHGSASQNQAADLNVRIQGVQQALAVLRDNAPRRQAEASLAYCGAARAVYAPVAARVCAALAELGSAMQAHDSFTAEIVAGGANPVFLPMIACNPVAALTGNLRSGDSPLCAVLRSAKEAGYYNPDKAVAEWRAPAPAAPPAMFAEEQAALREAVADRESIPKTRRTTVHRATGRAVSIPPGMQRPAEAPKSAIQRVADAMRGLLPGGGGADPEVAVLAPAAPGAAP